MRVVIMRPDPMGVPGDTLVCVAGDKVPNIVVSIARRRRAISPSLIAIARMHHRERPAGVVKANGLPA